MSELVAPSIDNVARAFPEETIGFDMKTLAKLAQQGRAHKTVGPGSSVAITQGMLTPESPRNISRIVFPWHGNYSQPVIPERIAQHMNHDSHNETSVETYFELDGQTLPVLKQATQECFLHGANISVGMQRIVSSEGDHTNAIFQFKEPYSSLIEGKPITAISVSQARKIIAYLAGQEEAQELVQIDLDKMGINAVFLIDDASEAKVIFTFISGTENTLITMSMGKQLQPDYISKMFGSNVEPVFKIEPPKIYVSSHAVADSTIAN